ncbi:MAG: TadE family protein [Alphaproteobacteria bacterium]
MELALVLPVLFGVLFAIIEFGFVLFLHNNMVNAAREAARRLAVGDVVAAGTTTCPGPANSAEDVACDYLVNWGLNFTLAATEPAPADPVRDVTMAISVPLADATPIDILGIFTSGNLRANAVMRKEE